MKPRKGLPAINRRMFLSLGLAACSGCASNWIWRGQSPETSLTEEYTSKKFVGDFTKTTGLNWLKLEAIALVTGLAGTGSDPPPSPFRDQLKNDMLARQTQDPDSILASPSTSMVLCRGYVPPGAQKGDRFDVEVRLPNRSETTSLRGGFLMQTRMRRVELLGGLTRQGDIDGYVRGDVLIDSIFDGQTDPVNEVRGRVLSGGVNVETRPLGLVIRRDEASILISTLIGKAINNRFHYNDRGQKKGVATPKKDDFLELTVHPRYKHNLARYLRVIRSLAVQESAVERTERLQLLEKKVQQPASAAVSALQLEAIGKEGVDALKAAVTNPDPEVRFYSAEALAYLDEPDATPPLVEAAKSVSAFRWHALAALAAMTHVSAASGLSDLLHVASVETRYGAFRAKRQFNPYDPDTGGLAASDQANWTFAYHAIPTTGEPLVHVTRTRQPEVVVFGHEQKIKPPQFLFAGKNVLVKGQPDGGLRVSRFAPGAEDKAENCGATLDELIRTLVKVGASYGEVVLMLLEAKKQGLLEGKVAVEAIPRPDRKYYRDENDPSDTPPSEAEAHIGDLGPSGDSSQAGGAANSPPTAGELADPGPARAATPAPNLYRDGIEENGPQKNRQELTETYIDPGFQPQSTGILDKLNPFPKAK